MVGGAKGWKNMSPLKKPTATALLHHEHECRGEKRSNERLALQSAHVFGNGGSGEKDSLIRLACLQERKSQRRKKKKKKKQKPQTAGAGVEWQLWPMRSCAHGGQRRYYVDGKQPIRLWARGNDFVLSNTERFVSMLLIIVSDSKWNLRFCLTAKLNGVEADVSLRRFTVRSNTYKN